MKNTLHDKLTWIMAFTLTIMGFTLIGVMTYLSIIDVTIPYSFHLALIILVASISGVKFLLPLLIKHLGM